MAAAFDTWTVLPHEPLEKLAPNLWHVEGVMPDGKVRRHMTLAKMRDGRVVVHNAIALEPDLMSELEAWGRPSFIVVPNGYHRQDAKIWKQRYPDALVIAPAGAAKAVAKVVPVEGSYADLPKDDDVTLTHLDGVKDKEGVLEVTSDGKTTVTFNDAVLNMPKLGGPAGFFLSPTGRISVPRVMRWMAISDKRRFAAHIERLAGLDTLSRVIFGHGPPIEGGPGAALLSALSSL